MFKYRVLTFTIILSMLLFYATPINSVDVKADEVTYTQRQLQDVGAWFIGERLLEGTVENFNFNNLPTDVTVDDFLADLGAIIAEGNPDPLIDDLGQAAEDIWNGIEQEVANWTADDAWSLVKDTFYTLWYDVNPPTSFPLADVLIMADGINEQLGVYDRLLQYANTDIPEPQIPTDYSYLLQIGDFNFYNTTTKFIESPYDFMWKDFSYNMENPFIKNNYSYLQANSSSFVNNFNGINTVSQFYISTPGDVYINTISGSNNVTVQYSNFNLNTYKFSSSYMYYAQYFTSFSFSDKLYFNNWNYGNTFDSLNLQRTFVGLDTALNYIFSHCRHINLYVNNVPWFISHITPINPIASNDLTYPNYEPAKYNYPDGTSVDWNRLYTIIYNAVRDGIVIDFGDLEDCFVDVSGQTAIATLGLVRNDYDSLVQEQFTMIPYPRFNDNLWLTNLADEMTEPAQNGVAIIENAYNIFPLPLQKALLFAGAMLLFGLLIRRFLE